MQSLSQIHSHYTGLGAEVVRSWGGGCQVLGRRLSGDRPSYRSSLLELKNQWVGPQPQPNLSSKASVITLYKTSLGVMCHTQVFLTEDSNGGLQLKTLTEDWLQLRNPTEGSDWWLRLRTPTEDSDWGLRHCNFFSTYILFSWVKKRVSSKWKTTKTKNNQNGRRPRPKTIKMEDDQNILKLKIVDLAQILLVDCRCKL